MRTPILLVLCLPLLLAADYPLPCSGPEHAQRRNEPGWRNVLGRLSSPRPPTAQQLRGYLCEACARVQRQRIAEVGRLIRVAAASPDPVRASQLIDRAHRVRAGIVGAAPPTEVELGQIRVANGRGAEGQAQMRRLWLMAILPAVVLGIVALVLCVLLFRRRGHAF